MNFFWSGHLPHHLNEELNFSVALRQGAFQDTLVFPVFLPMAFMGCPIEVFAAVLLLNKYSQFWVHTRAIKRVPLIKGVLNTPSAHRVQHAVVPIYIDKNHGGVLMLWDKLFGTWVEEREDEPCVFGVRKPYRSCNPLSAHVDWWARLWKDAVNTRSWSEKFKLWFMPTGWRPADVEQSDPSEPYDLTTYEKYDPKTRLRRKASALALFLLTLPLISHLLYEQFTLPILEKAGVALAVLGCLYLCGHLLDGK